MKISSWVRVTGYNSQNCGQFFFIRQVLTKFFETLFCSGVLGKDKNWKDFLYLCLLPGRRAFFIKNNLFGPPVIVTKEGYFVLTVAGLIQNNPKNRFFIVSFPNKTSKFGPCKSNCFHY